MAALVLFVMTAVLLIKGPAALGDPVGPNLALLDSYLPGYEVSWSGVFVGCAWAFLHGLVFGVVAALLLNGYHTVYLRILERQLRREGLLGG